MYSLLNENETKGLMLKLFNENSFLNQLKSIHNGTNNTKFYIASLLGSDQPGMLALSQNSVKLPKIIPGEEKWFKAIYEEPTINPPIKPTIFDSKELAQDVKEFLKKNQEECISLYNALNYNFQINGDKVPGTIFGEQSIKALQSVHDALLKSKTTMTMPPDIVLGIKNA